MKPKINRAGDKKESKPFDRCNTPAYALTPLLPYLPQGPIYWEPAAGTGNIAEALLPRMVVTGDILTGQDYFDTPPYFDIQVTNPPYSIKFDWVARAYELGKPFALLVPVETIGAKKAQHYMERHGVELLLLNRRVDFDMPNMGYSGKGAQFPVLWFCWKLLPAPIMYGEIIKG